MGFEINRANGFFLFDMFVAQPFEKKSFLMLYLGLRGRLFRLMMMMMMMSTLRKMMMRTRMVMKMIILMKKMMMIMWMKMKLNKTTRRYYTPISNW